MGNSSHVHDACTANNPINHGWKEEDGKLIPSWTSLPLARDVFSLDVKCTCKITCSLCKCVKAKLKCTRLCKCTFTEVAYRKIGVLVIIRHCHHSTTGITKQLN